MTTQTLPKRPRKSTPKKLGTARTAQRNAPPTPEPKTRTGTTPPTPKTYRTSAEAMADRAALVREADTLHSRSQSATLTAEEDARLSECLDQAEQLDGTIKRLQREERLNAQRSQLNTPTRSAVAPVATIPATPRADQFTPAEAFQVWMRSVMESDTITNEERQRCAPSGMPLGSSSLKVACDYGTLNQVKRRAMSKGGTGTGKELVPAVTFSEKLVEYISYFSPFLTLLDSETTVDGNDRDYPRLDDTAMISTYITASGGSELTPTIPDADMATGGVRIKAHDITSGYQKLSRQVLRDSPFSLFDKVMMAIGNSHARRMERDTILGTGTDQPRGLVTAATSHAAVTDFTADTFESMYFSMPIQYRRSAIWLVSDEAMGKMKKKLKDTTGRTLFTKTMEDNAEVEQLHGRPVYVSEWMPGYVANAKPVLFFSPMFYLLRMIAGQTVDILREKFYPHIAYAGNMAFGGDWRGPASACKCLTMASSGLVA